MSKVKLQNQRAMLLAIAGLLGAESSIAETLCTFVPDAAAMPVAEIEHESNRVSSSRLFAGFIESGNQQASDGMLAHAASLYNLVFEPFEHDGLQYGFDRCALPSIYKEAADGLRAVAIPYAQQLMANAYYLPDESPHIGYRLPRGALNLLLISNSYDAFIEHSFDYAVHELQERDIDDRLQGLVAMRLQHLRSLEEISLHEKNGLEDDTAPLLGAELAAYDKLEGYHERLSAHLEPLFPKITDHWLLEESIRHSELVKFDADISDSQLDIRQSSSLENATGALNQGIVRLSKHPDEVRRLQDRANERGEAFMAKEKYTIAENYFKVAGNEQRRAQAAEIIDDRGKDRIQALEIATKKDIERMLKSDTERAMFEDGADDMAEEFKFDLEN